MLATGAAFARGNHRVSEIAICGAGVGGLMPAARLAQMGRKPILFEARSETATTSEGVFLTLAPNGMNGLRSIGCYQAVRASGIDTHLGVTNVNTIVGGKIIRQVHYLDHAEALKALGLAG